VARLLADENFPFPVTQELRRLGHDVVTVTLEELGYHPDRGSLQGARLCSAGAVHTR
jgi:hypothetical protein